MPVSNYTPYQKTRNALIHHFSRSKTAAIWHQYGVAVAAIADLQPTEYCRAALEVGLKCVCPFCKAPHTILGNAWADLTPLWMKYSPSTLNNSL